MYQHTVLTIYMRHKYNTTAAHEKRIILFLDFVNHKSLSYITETLKQKL